MCEVIWLAFQIMLTKTARDSGDGFWAEGAEGQDLLCLNLSMALLALSVQDAISIAINWVFCSLESIPHLDLVRGKRQRHQG